MVHEDEYRGFSRFSSVPETPWSTETTLSQSSLRSQILFLNKDDIFRRKIKDPRSQIVEYFPEFQGPRQSLLFVRGLSRGTRELMSALYRHPRIGSPAEFDYDAGKQFFKKKFVSLNRSTNKEVYTQ
jgi:hypothetical protein